MAKTPMNPLAGVSGPGPFSVRDDQLNLGSTVYGDDTAALDPLFIFHLLTLRQWRRVVDLYLVEIVQ